MLLSGYASDLYDVELYPDWWRVERRALRRSSNGRSATNVHTHEVTWSNWPLADGRLAFEEER